MFRWRPPIAVVNRANRANGSSNAFWITMYGNPGSTAAVLAQEMAEFQWKWTRIYGPGLIVLGLLAWFFDPLFLALSAPLFVVNRFPALRRALELWGHEVEVQAAVALYGASEGEYRAKEAMGMWRGYSGLFSGMTLAEVDRAMVKRGPAAERRVRRWMPVLVEFKERWR